MIFHLEVPDCCSPWRLVTVQVMGAVSRSWVECSGCGKGQVLTVTRRSSREDEFPSMAVTA